MLKLRVIAPDGAKLSGPAVLALTADQASARAHVLAPAKGRGRWSLTGETAFKLGEAIGFVGTPDKVSLAQFEPADVATARKMGAESGEPEDGDGDGDAGDAGSEDGTGDGDAGDAGSGDGTGDDGAPVDDEDEDEDDEGDAS